ncbi:Mut7-C RNAse domain-containing protein [Ferrimonas balearica]|uniref:Mut7-C RNAse domain-containing protein n=1 Tax=Ferrimonas balearica TaxID=44012 RepID=UPI001C99C5C1|nr:Mut7-C RNAse domain-containing protein [Ferrimonas balearica]MBY5920148.1 Mut7-C RNAse domain-containing protein [Ferrimonas balearica]MBY5997167.1 Mut7-C RNAse domain-containing protein [Ferrimonas balearica]
MNAANPRFLTDAMLIRLARWLRALGYDTLDCPGANDAQLVARANDQQRWLLTRDRALLSELRPATALYIVSQQPLEQLGQVLSHFQLTPTHIPFSRCMLCNRPLVLLSPDVSLPTYASHRTNELCKRCPACNRVYWFGAHANRMTQTLNRAGLLPPG